MTLDPGGKSGKSLNPSRVSTVPSGITLSGYGRQCPGVALGSVEV